jgi:endonuclease III
MPVSKRLQKIVEMLAKRFEAEEKKGELTDQRDPFLLGAWQILGEHAKRNGQFRAFDALRRAKGHTPGQLLDLPEEKLKTICQLAGPYDDQRMKNLYAYADAIEEKCGQDFAKIFKKPVAEIRKYLQNDLKFTAQFVDLMLMYAGFPIVAMDIRVARPASRLGFGKIKSPKSLDEKSYKEMQKALEAEFPVKELDELLRTHGLFYRLGNDVCHAVEPNCLSCPAAAECPYLKKNPVKPREENNHYTPR